MGKPWAKQTCCLAHSLEGNKDEGCRAVLQDKPPTPVSETASWRLQRVLKHREHHEKGSGLCFVQSHSKHLLCFPMDLIQNNEKKKSWTGTYAPRHCPPVIRLCPAYLLPHVKMAVLPENVRVDFHFLASFLFSPPLLPSPTC